MFNALVTTFDVYEDDDNTNVIINSNEAAGQPKPYQTVVAVGNAVHDIKVGDVVAIDFTKYARTKHKEGSLKDGVIQDNPVVSYEFNSIVIDDKEHLFLHTNDILFVIEDFEEVEDSQLITTKKEVVS
jgi:co-chaperonin GroES (HSP10)